MRATVALGRPLDGAMRAMRSLARRGLATAAKPAAGAAAPPPSGAAAGEVTVPLKLFGLPARYASALYVAASKAKELATVEKELLSVVDLAKKEPKFAQFLHDPSASKADKHKGVSSFLESGKFSATTKNFFGACTAMGRPRWTGDSADRSSVRGQTGSFLTGADLFAFLCSAVLAENGRLPDVELISAKFEELMMASRGEVKAVVTSAEVRYNATNPTAQAPRTPPLHHALTHPAPAAERGGAGERESGTGEAAAEGAVAQLEDTGVLPSF